VLSVYCLCYTHHSRGGTSAPSLSTHSSTRPPSPAPWAEALTTRVEAGVHQWRDRPHTTALSREDAAFWTGREGTYVWWESRRWQPQP
jgi:hypothetical protein